MFTRRSMMAAAASPPLSPQHRPSVVTSTTFLASESSSCAALCPRPRAGHRSGPKVVQFKMTIEEKQLVIDDEGTKSTRHDLQRFDAWVR